MRKMLAATVAFGAVMAGGVAIVGGAGAQAQAPPADAATAQEAVAAAAQADSVRWGRCADPTLVAFGARCATVQVPLDYSKPNGKTVGIAVSRIRHTVPDSQFQGILLVNPGGPGGSGLIYSVLSAFVPGGAGGFYDWIGFDPRGVGSSEGALSCIPDYFGYDRPNYVPTTSAIEQQWLDRSKRYAQACGARNRPGLLANMTTPDVAKDMDTIRQALGQKKLNYYGFSYGTYLGQVYATLFPEKVRRMVFDANVDPRNIWYQSQLDQDKAFDANIKIYFDWVARYRDVYRLGATGQAVEKLYYQVLNELDAKPAGGLIGPSEWNDIFVGAAYYIFGWEDIASAFAGWVHNKDWRPLKELYDSAVGVGDDNGFAVYLGVQCTDAHWPPRWSKWRDDSWRIYAKAPFLTWNNTWFNAPCLTWPAKSENPVNVDGSHVPGILLLGETKDAATPFEGSLEVRSRFPASSLIAGPGGTTHAASLSGNACVDNRIAAYLASGVLPPRKPGRRADTTCPPLPQPVPGQAAAAAAMSAEAAAGVATPIVRQRLRDAAGPVRLPGG
jgi:pimeloyl-ACP methyl ester carboxylesterase